MKLDQYFFDIRHLIDAYGLTRNGIRHRLKDKDIWRLRMGTKQYFCKEQLEDMSAVPRFPNPYIPYIVDSETIASLFGVTRQAVWLWDHKGYIKSNILLRDCRRKQYEASQFFERSR